MSSASEESTLIERLIAASARNKFLIAIFTIFGVAAGIFALQRTPLDAIPDLSDVQVIVYTDWEGPLARPCRGPDYLSDLHALYRCAEGQIRPRRIDVRQIICLCDL